VLLNHVVFGSKLRRLIQLSCANFSLRLATWNDSAPDVGGEYYKLQIFSLARFQSEQIAAQSLVHIHSQKDLGDKEQSVIKIEDKFIDVLSYDAQSMFCGHLVPRWMLYYIMGLHG
jgi:hypothetical protein